jgi:heme exporter protein A
MDEGVLLRLSALLVERGNLPLFAPLDLAVHAGEAVVIEAANGVGKTSLLRAIAGLLPPASGSIERRRHPGARLRFLAHQLGIKGPLAVAENLRFWTTLDGVRAEPAQILAALDQVGLPGFEWQAGQTLSAGQRKRVALARLALDPGELWLLDEPFANLDAAGCALVGKAIADQRGRGGAVLLTSHGGALPVALPDARTLRLQAHP